MFKLIETALVTHSPFDVLLHTDSMCVLYLVSFNKEVGSKFKHIYGTPPTKLYI